MLLKTKKRTNRKAIIIVTVALLTAIAAGFFIMYSVNKKSLSSSAAGVDYSPATKSQTDTGSQTKSDTINSSSDDQSTKPSTTETTTTPVTPSSGQAISVLIPFAQQQGTNIRITTNISRITSSGQCILSMTKSGSDTYTQTVGVQALASSATCQGFNVPVAQLNSGIWQITVTYNDTNYTGSATSQVSVE